VVTEKKVSAIEEDVRSPTVREGVALTPSSSYV